MMIDRRSLLGTGAAGFAFTAIPGWARPVDTGTALIDALAEEYLKLSPESATELGIDTGARAALKAASSDDSPAGRARLVAWLRSALARIDAADTPGIDPTMATHLAVARTAYRNALDGFAFPYGSVSVGGWRNGPYVVAQNMGAYLDTPKFLDSSHSIATSADAEAYLQRLAALPGALDAETARLKDARGRGVVAPDFVIAKTLDGMRLTRREAPAQSLLVTALVRHTATIPGDWGKKAQAIVAGRVMPALDRQIAELEAHRAIATPDAGVWKFSDGAAYYTWALGAATTTRMTPEDVHATGQAELDALQAEMDTILKSLGLTQGSVGARMLALTRDPRFTFAPGDAGRAQIMAFIEGRIADIRPRLPRAFNTLVRGNVEVKRIAPAEEIGAPGAYGGAGSIDGKVPGRFWINLRDPAAHTRFSLPTLTYHEAIPGHVWQGEYSHRLPLLRTLMGFSAFSEGWALYAEQLGAELGVYDDDPVGRLGYLNSMAFRAARMVVDTGIHTKRWTRDRARTWFAEATGDTVEGVTSEIDRYCVWPGQACAYKVGHTEINRQRKRAQTALAGKFDVRAFNDLVVGGGGRPLVVMERDVDRYVAATRGG